MRRGALGAIAVTAAALTIVTPVSAGPFSALAKLARGAKAVGKGGKLVANGVKVGKAAKVAALGGGALAAERAGPLLLSLPDDVARGAAYVTRETDGALRFVRNTGGNLEHAVHPSQGLTRAVDDVAAGAGSVDLYVDVGAAMQPRSLPRPGVDRRLHALDAQGKPHPIRSEGDSLWVDVAEGSLDLAQFAYDQAVNGESAASTDTRQLWWLGLGAPCVEAIEASLGRPLDARDSAAKAWLDGHELERVVVVTGADSSWDDAVAAVGRGGHDAVLLRLHDDCDPGQVQRLVIDVLAASAGRGERAPLAGAFALASIDARTEHDALTLRGAVPDHPVVTEAAWRVQLADDGEEPVRDRDDPPLWFYGLVVLGGGAWVGLRLRKRQAERSPRALDDR